MLFRKVIPGSTSRLAIVDHTETYGRHILKNVIKKINVSKCIDIGCGHGYDLSIVKQQYPGAKLYGVDFGAWNADKLKSLGIKPIIINFEL